MKSNIKGTIVERNIHPRTPDDYDNEVEGLRTDDDEHVVNRCRFESKDVEMPKSQANKRQTLLRVLEPDGLADQVMACARKAKGSKAKSIRHDWEAELIRLRATLKPLSRSDGSKLKFLTSQSIADLDRPLDDPESDGPSAFLLWLLSKHSDVSCAKRITDLARKAYRAQPRIYDRICGEFLDDDFKKQIRLERYEDDENLTVADDWTAFADILNDKDSIHSEHLQTGIKPLDKLLGGISQLTILAGPTGSEKTTLALNLAVGVIQRDPNVCVLFLSAELSKTHLNRKLLSHISGVPYDRLASNSERSEQEDEKLRQAGETIRTSVGKRLRIVDKKARTPLLLSDVRSMIQALRDETECDVCVVIVDSLDRIVLGERREMDGDCFIAPKLDASDEERLQFLLDRQHWTRNSTTPDGWPLIVITRTRKGSGGQNRLDIDDVFGTVDLTFDARTVLLLQRWGESQEPYATPVRLTAAKVGDGGECGEFQLLFRHTVSSFDEFAARSRANMTKGRAARHDNGGRPRLRDQQREVAR